MDMDWVRRAAGGEVAAMEFLYERYKAMVYSVGLALCGNRDDADEVVQETFLRAFRKLSQWRGESLFSTWLYSVALRTAQNWKTRFAGRRTLPIPARSEPSEPEQNEQLMAAIQELPEQQRVTLLMKHLQGLRIREIALLQGCAEGTVKANLHHALRSLLRKLGREPE